MELQNYFPRDDIKAKAVDVAKYIAEEVRPDERDEAVFAILIAVEKVLNDNGDCYSAQFTYCELLEKLYEKFNSGRYRVVLQGSVFSKIIAENV